MPSMSTSPNIPSLICKEHLHINNPYVPIRMKERHKWSICKIQCLRTQSN